MTRKRKSNRLDPADVLRIFKENRRPLGRNDILRQLERKANKPQVEEVLSRLVDEGRIIKLKGGAYGLTESLRLVTGTLEIQRSGVGFVLCEDKRRKDIFINPGHLGDAWHGDRVAVAILSERGRRPQGRIVRILERGRTRLSAHIIRQLSQDLLLCKPTDAKLNFSLALKAEPHQELRIGDVIIAEAGEQLDRDLYDATLVKRLGQEDDLSVQEALVKANNRVPTEFPASVLREAENMPGEPGSEDFTSREDLRHIAFVTVDGAKARDFDDAIYVERRGKNHRLLVAIADVSHYVAPGSNLDREAQERGNSYYFPLSVEPMFPEALSNGLCSLNPDVPRLAMVAEMTITPEGEPRDERFYPAVIRSHGRLTYAQVNRAVLLKEKEERENIKQHLPMLELAENLARLLLARRQQRGSLDFDLPEPEILFNIHGETVNIQPKARHFGHQIIEEFMIAANEAVARFLKDRDLPCLYRIHPDPDPDKLNNLFAMLKATGLPLPLPANPSAKSLQELLTAAEGTSVEFLVNRLVLRSMMQAKYDPDNQGHFGLASDCYCHFTSPIRRYADLVVHRSLKLALSGNDDPKASNTFKGLKRLSDEINILERRAVDAEREILKRFTILFLRDRVDETFTGVISSFMDFGFWVELNEVLAEGMIRLSSLNDDYYTFFPERQEIIGQRTGNRYRLGQTLKVRLKDVNLSRLEITLDLDTKEQKEDDSEKSRETRQKTERKNIFLDNQAGGPKPRRRTRRPKKSQGN